MKTSPALPKWFLNNEDKWEWVYRYLERNAAPRTLRGINLATHGIDKPSYEWVAYAVSHLEKSGEPEFLGRLKGALRQHKHLSATPGRKHQSFSIPGTINNRLQEIAKKQKVSKNEIFIDALNNLEKTTTQHKRTEQQLKEELKHAKARANQLINTSKIELEVAMAHIKNLAEKIAKWELSMETQNPEYDGNQETLEKAARKITKPIEDEIKLLKSKNNLITIREI